MTTPSFLRGAVRGAGAAAVLLLPTLARAATPAAGAVLSLKNGPAYAITQTTLGYAWGGVFFAFVLSMFFEFAHSGGHHQHGYAPILMRTFLVVIGLNYYSVIFGTVVTTANAIANKVTPQQAYSQFFDDAQVKMKRMLQGDSGALDPQTGSLPGSLSTTPASSTSSLGGMIDQASATLHAGLARTGDFIGGRIFSSLIQVCIVFCLILHRLFWVMGTSIVAFLYSVGPLVLAAAVPKQTGVLGTWFRHLVTVACWPIVSGLLIQFVFALGQQWNSTNDAVDLTVLFTAACMAATCMITPKLASSLVGGMGNVTTPGLALAAGALMLAGKKLSPDKKKDKDAKGKDGKGGPAKEGSGSSSSTSSAPGSAAAVVSNPVGVRSAGASPSLVDQISALPPPQGPLGYSPAERAFAYDAAHAAVMAEYPPAVVMRPEQLQHAQAEARAAGIAAESKLPPHAPNHERVFEVAETTPFKDAYAQHVAMAEARQGPEMGPSNPAVEQEAHHAGVRAWHAHLQQNPEDGARVRPLTPAQLQEAGVAAPAAAKVAGAGPGVQPPANAPPQGANARAGSPRVAARDKSQGRSREPTDRVHPGDLIDRGIAHPPPGPPKHRRTGGTNAQGPHARQRRGARPQPEAGPHPAAAPPRRAPPPPPLAALGETTKPDERS